MTEDRFSQRRMDQRVQKIADDFAARLQLTFDDIKTLPTSAAAHAAIKVVLLIACRRLWSLGHGRTPGTEKLMAAMWDFYKAGGNE